MKPETLIFFLVLFIGFIALWKEKRHPAAIFFIMITVFTITGIITPEEAIKGFSNPHIITIVLLIVLSNVIKRTKIVEGVLSRFLSHSLSSGSYTFRMMLIVSSFSAFFNNTPIVAFMMPYVDRWSRLKGISSSKFMISLSYAAIVGGTATLMGTSTNLVINALYTDKGNESLGFFEFLPVGIVLIFAAALYMTFIGIRLLPERKNTRNQFSSNTNDYLVEVRVSNDFEGIDCSVSDAKLRNLKELFLVEIKRGENNIYPVSKDEKIKEGDILTFAGNTSGINSLVHDRKGLKLYQDLEYDKEANDIIEATISINSSLNNQKIKDSDFRSRFKAAIIGVCRDGEKIKGKIGNIILKPGDSLLLLTDDEFSDNRNDNDFHILSKIQGNRFVPDIKNLTAILAVPFLLIGILSGFFNLFHGLLIVISFFLLFNITSISQMKKDVDLNIFVVAALAMALGKAVENSGTAQMIADLIKQDISGLGTLAVLFTVFIISNILTEFMANTAVASVVLPIVFSISSMTSISLKPLVLLTAYGASSCFMTPIGYQTNLMVYSAGNYKFKDFFRSGVFFSILYMFVSVFMIYFLYF